MSSHNAKHPKAGEGPYLTEDQWQKVNRELWCIVRLADNTEASVYYVDGFAMRNWVDVGFIGGGHGFYDPFLHRNEIVIERMKDPHDEVAFLHHEAAEINKIIKGEKYDDAHNFANNSESKYRQGVWQVPAPHLSEG